MRTMLILGGLMAALSLVSCKAGEDPLATASDKAAAVLNSVEETLASVKDSDTAKAAEKKLDDLIAKLRPAMDSVKNAMKTTAAKTKEGVDVAGQKAKGVMGKAKAAFSKAFSATKTKVTDQIDRLKDETNVTPELKEKVEELQGMLEEG